jgi:4-amino-4-deoxy-L-arabinose transferase-like glycosyltransferase
VAHKLNPPSAGSLSASERARSPAGPPRPETLRLPEKSLREWTVAFLLFAFSILLLWPLRVYGPLNADEGIVLQGAQRILQGQVLYRDFFYFVTPGSFYFMAMLFKVFGSSILVGRNLLLIYGGVFSVLTYLLARRVCSTWAALLAAYFQLVVSLPTRFHPLHNWDSMLWACLALYGFVWLLQQPHWIWALITGSCVSFTGLFEQSKGAGLVVGLLLGFSVIALKHRRAFVLKRSHLAALLAGAAWPILLTLVYFGLKGSLSQMAADLLWPIEHYTRANRLPYGYIFSPHVWEEAYTEASSLGRLLVILVFTPGFVISAVPILGVGFAVFKTLEKRPEGPTETSSYYVLVSATVLGLVLSVLAAGRADMLHLVYEGPPLFVVLGWLMEGPGIRSALLQSARPLVAGLLVVCFTAYGMAFLSNPLGAHERLVTRRGTLRASSPDRLLQYVQEHVPAGAKILVYPYQPLFYFLTATFSPTRYDYLQPGFHAPSQFHEALGDLARDKTPVVLYDLGFTTDIVPVIWPSIPTGALAVDPLEDYIFAHYRPCAVLTSQVWRFVYMVRKDSSCPSHT